MAGSWLNLLESTSLFLEAPEAAWPLAGGLAAATVLFLEDCLLDAFSCNFQDLYYMMSDLWV